MLAQRAELGPDPRTGRAVVSARSPTCSVCARDLASALGGAPAPCSRHPRERVPPDVARCAIAIDSALRSRERSRARQARHLLNKNQNGTRYLVSSWERHQADERVPKGFVADLTWK